MTDTEIEELPLHLQLMQNKCKSRHFAKSNLKGKGVREYIKTLPSFHYSNGKSPPISTGRPKYDSYGFPTGEYHKKRKYGKCVTDVAIKVWNDPDALASWFLHHKAVSRLVPNL